MKSSAYRRRREYKETPPEERVLVAVMNNARDMAIAREQGWYRIPVRTAPKQMDFGWLAFYQTMAFKHEGCSVSYYARVTGRSVVKRCELLPQEPHHPRANEDYHKICFSMLEKLPRSIGSRGCRRLIFVPTIIRKLWSAREVNDLFHESPLEDALWEGFKERSIQAERQWYVKPGVRFYCLDFAVFCRNRFLDVECDGDTWHKQPDQIVQDNARDRALTSRGWAVLRFDFKQVWQKINHCLDRVCETINRYGGVVTPEGRLELCVTCNGTPRQLSSPMEEIADYAELVD